MGDESKRSIGLWWDLNAQVDRLLQETSIHLFFGLFEAQDHHPVGIIVVLFVRQGWLRLCKCLLHVGQRSFLSGGHGAGYDKLDAEGVQTRAQGA